MVTKTLQRPTLVLNRNWQPVHVATVARALVLWTPEQAGIKLRRKPIRPAWKPLYADHSVRIASWSKFVSEAYWNVQLEG